MFMKKDMARYKSGCADKNPEELPGVRENRFFCPLRVEKYGLNIWMGYIAFVLDETMITEEVILEIADALIKPGKQFMRAAFVGADRLSCKKLKKLLYGHGFAIQFFDGIEPAKEWLLDERGI